MNLLTKQEIETLLDAYSRANKTNAEEFRSVARTALALMAQLEDAKAARALVGALREAVEGLLAVLDRNDKKGPIPDVEMMFCWLAAQEVRAAFRKIAPKGEAT